MRRIVTWTLAAAVDGLGVAAAVDALRGGSEPERADAVQPEATTTGPAAAQERTLATASADLRRAGIPEGRLVYWDERCSASVLTLPDLAVRPPRGPEPCRFGWSSGRWVETPDPRPDASYWGDCRRGWLRLWRGPPWEHELYARGRGCAAAWKPDGTVTFIRDGEVRRFVRCPGDGRAAPLRCSEPVLTRAELARQLLEQRWAAVRPRFTELAWLDDQRFAAIFEQRTPDGSFEGIVLFDRGRLVNTPMAPYDELGGLTPSPTGARVAAFEVDKGGIVAIDRAGRLIPLPLDRGSGIAWSPDENWIAEASEGGIYVFRADDESPEPIQIPVAARDLLWSAP